jgi:hypothetical protein
MNQNPSDSGIPGDSVCSETALAPEMPTDVVGNAVHVMRVVAGQIEEVIQSGEPDAARGSSGLLENHA